MPKYKFMCKDCSNLQEEVMSISDYRRDKENIFCKKCNSKNTTRIFNDLHSNVEKDMDDILNDIKDEKKILLDKINSGDVSTISDIYGTELNKLKVK